MVSDVDNFERRLPKLTLGNVKKCVAFDRSDKKEFERNFHVYYLLFHVFSSLFVFSSSSSSVLSLQGYFKMIFIGLSRLGMREEERQSQRMRGVKDREKEWENEQGRENDISIKNRRLVEPKEEAEKNNERGKEETKKESAPVIFFLIINSGDKDCK